VGEADDFAKPTLAHGATLAFRLYVDPDWADDEAWQTTGAWIVMSERDAAPDSVHYAIAEYLDAEVVQAARGGDDAALAGLGVQADDLPDDFTQGLRFWISEQGWASYLNVADSGWLELSFFFGQDGHAWTLQATILK